MTKAVLVCMHNYCPMYNHKYFDVVYDYFMHNFSTIWGDEVDKLYIIDSNWGVGKVDDSRVAVFRINPNYRYYDAYKMVLPKIDADSVLFLDNDMVIYKKGIVKRAFDKLKKYDVATIYDLIGNYKTDKLNGKNKFCPYFFTTRKDLLMKYRDCEWGPAMPEHETLGKLTEKMLDDGIRPFEMEEDKTSLLFDGSNQEKKSKDLGYYHIRGGSEPAFLLTHRNLGTRKTYEDHIKTQPKSEILRRLAWYEIMCRSKYPSILKGLDMVLKDMRIDKAEWSLYLDNFKKFHGL